MSNQLFISLEEESSTALSSVITLFVKTYCKSQYFETICVKKTSVLNSSFHTYLLGSLFQGCLNVDFQEEREEDISDVVRKCNFPSVLDELGICYTGLGTVLRKIVLRTGSPLEILGFRQTCLKNCAEGSIWTELAESSMPKSVFTFLSKTCSNDNTDKLDYYESIPDAIETLEKSLALPISGFNIEHQKNLLRDEKEDTDASFHPVNSQILFNYKTSSAVVNKKTYREAVKKYKAAIANGLIPKGVTFKKSQFYIPLESGSKGKEENGDLKNHLLKLNGAKADVKIHSHGLDGQKDVPPSEQPHVPSEEDVIQVSFRDMTVAENGDGHVQKLGLHSNASTNDDNRDLCVAIDEDCNVRKRFTQGWNMTLVDLALFLPVHLYLNHLIKKHPDAKSFVVSNLPRTLMWYQNMWKDERLVETASKVAILEIKFPNVPKQKCMMGKLERVGHVEGEYRKGKSSKAKRHAGRRLLPGLLHVLDSHRAIMKCKDHPVNDIKLKWSSFPDAINPLHGDVPNDRLHKKQHQIESLVSVVKLIAKDGNIIVDFCSGGGHVGIVLAFLLPRCHIIMIENKEESLRRAWQRISCLDLKNVTLYQSNIEYFTGKFDIGLSLHACGSATDMVINKCLHHSASIVCSPCCYGALTPSSTIPYPRSKLFTSMDVTEESFLIAGHTAEQTNVEVQNQHMKQGKLCMCIVDTDRLSFIKEFEYRTSLSSLHPPTCSPKNNLLIAIPEVKIQDHLSALFV